MKKEHLWFLVPVITVLVILGTLAYFFLGPRLLNQAGEGENLIVTGDPVHYQDYLGKWIWGASPFEDSPQNREGFLVEIQSVRDHRVRGSFTYLSHSGNETARKYDFSGAFQEHRAAIRYHGSKGSSRRGILLLTGSQVAITPPDGNGSRLKKMVRARLHAKTVSLRETLGYLNLSRDQIIQRLGNAAKVFPSGPDGTQDGFYYPAHGVVVVFEKGKHKNRVAWIDCKEGVDINGVRPGQNFKTIRARLGSAPVIQTWLETPIHTVYELIYHIENGKVYFISEDPEGVNARALVYRG